MPFYYDAVGESIGLSRALLLPAASKALDRMPVRQGDEIVKEIFEADAFRDCFHDKTKYQC